MGRGEAGLHSTKFFKEQCSVYVRWFKFLELIAADQLGNGRAVPPHPPRTLLKCVSVLASGLKPNGNPARLNKV